MEILLTVAVATQASPHKIYITKLGDFRLAKTSYHKGCQFIIQFSYYAVIQCGQNKISIDVHFFHIILNNLFLEICLR